TSSPTQGRAPTPSDLPQYGRAPTGHPSTGRVPTQGGTNDQGPEAPRTITQSSGVPREAGDRGSSGANAASATGTFRAQRDRSPSDGVRRPGSQTNSPLSSRTRTGSSGLHTRPSSDSIARPRTSSSSQMAALNPPTQRPGGQASIRRKQSTAATMEIEALIQKKIPMLDQGVDYFTLFGLQIGASPEDVRSTYLMLARKLHPDRLAAIGIEDDERHAQRLMACINEAFAVLNDPIRRAEYMSILDRGGEAAVRAENQQADELAMKVMRAEEAFRQGEMCMRREQIAQAIVHFKEAVELQPAEPEYQALLAWAHFAHATDKNDVATLTRKALMKAAEMNLDSPTARFYLGRVERMLGREKEALYWFYEVLKLKPNHSEARSEARILEQRIKAKR
ncbi:MAG TPA: DnaJ domain-containing protein, partial [Kofleriaceae bacterium]|nr:DnaJ domain-containing protein [Kofleriaceae bacterium]